MILYASPPYGAGYDAGGVNLSSVMNKGNLVTYLGSSVVAAGYIVLPKQNPDFLERGKIHITIPMIPSPGSVLLGVSENLSTLNVVLSLSKAGNTSFLKFDGSTAPVASEENGVTTAAKYCFPASDISANTLVWVLLAGNGGFLGLLSA
jgi:hypothetical protein